VNKRFGQPHQHLEIVDSTNARARSMVREGSPHGTAVSADLQTAGRGRHDRSWESDSGKNLLVSYIARPERDPADWSGLALLSGVAVADAIRDLTPCSPHLKWPNDVLIGTRKISGVLIETGMEGARGWAVIGIGINVNQIGFRENLRMPATSLLLETGGEIEISRVFGALTERLEQWYETWDREGVPVIAEQWRLRTRMLGRSISVGGADKCVQYRVLGLNDDGSLSVSDEAGRVAAVFAGDITVHDT
jgi:BirA family transcriptional regulator, biotin operon repressor / biotin---[acetyl-CoA-carboxylase] ligase